MGFVAVQLILLHMAVCDLNAGAAPLAGMLGVFAVLMTVGAFCARSWIPNVQGSRPKSKQPNGESQGGKQMTFIER
jgi:hypothetical protein